MPMPGNWKQMRQAKTINSDWRFTYDADPQPDLARKDPEADAAGWQAVALPHTWSTFETTGNVHPFIRDPSERDNPAWWHGWGWYRKRFTAADTLRGRKLFAEFDGVQKYSRVYLNGAFVAEHKGGYTSFSVDLTPFLRPGQENLLAVQVSNRRDDSFGGIPPMTAGNFNVYGGIYRDVRLVVTDRVYIPFQGSAEHEGGTFITTPELDPARAIARVRTWVRNDRRERVQALLRTRLRDPDGGLIAELTAEATIAPGQLREFDQATNELPAPRLWSPESPAVYRAESEVQVGGRRVDTYVSPFGFRWFHWDYEARQLYLNGKPVRIRGTNRHQEYPWLGDALPQWIHAMDYTDMRRNLNHNFTRTCHYPNDPHVYDLTDRLGMIVCEEAPNIKNLRFGDDIQRQHVVEMIRRDRNHPSILMWSMGNETNCAADPDWARAEDPARIVHCRQVIGRGQAEPHNPSQINMENLLCCTIRGWQRDDEGPPDGQVAGSEVRQHREARVADGCTRGRIDWNNMVVWLYADHGADREYKQCPLLHFNPKGCVDACRQPKLFYWLYQANHLDRLMVHVQRRWWRRKYIGQRHAIVVDSNGATVELLLDGQSLGIRQARPEEFYSVTFPDIPITDGTLVARAVRGGAAVDDVMPMAGPPQRLSLAASPAAIAADRSGIALVTIDVTDASGVPVPGARPDVRIKVTGPGRLLTPRRLVSDIGRAAGRDGTMYTVMPFVAPVRATAQAGIILVQVSADGLAPAEIAIRSERPAVVETLPGIGEAFEPDGPAGNRPPECALPSGSTSARAPLVYEDLHFKPGSLEEYCRQIKEYLRRNFPAPAGGQPDGALVEELARLCAQNRGVLIADDFNFILSRGS